MGKNQQRLNVYTLLCPLQAYVFEWLEDGGGFGAEDLTNKYRSLGVPLRGTSPAIILVLSVSYLLHTRAVTIASSPPPDKMPH